MKKKYITLIICIICVSTGNAQNFSTQFLDSINRQDVSVATVNSAMIETLRRREQNPDIQAFLSELNFLRIISADNPRNAAALYENAISLLRKNEDFEELLSMEEGRQRVVIAALSKSEENRTAEVVMISYINNASLTIVNITGSIDISDLSQLAATIRNLR
jgi:hypothetical protein